MSERHRAEPPLGVGTHLTYMPALDGIRAVSILGIMANHGGFAWADGGVISVNVFFVLTGFLITMLLMKEWTRSGTIRLRAFWARRARRLLPALFVLLGGIGLYALFFAPSGTQSLFRGDGLATLFYVANWHQIVAGQSYFVQVSSPSPLLHTWTLAIEEQFYLVWPLVVLGVLKLTRSPRALFVVAVVGVLASATEMALLFHAGHDPSRLYYGTDTRAQDILTGAAMAILLYGRPVATGRTNEDRLFGHGRGRRLRLRPRMDPHQLVRVLPLPLRLPGGRCDGGVGHLRGDVGADRIAGPGTRGSPARLRRTDLLWPLPLALAGLPRPQRFEDRAHGLSAVRRPGGRHLRHRHRLLVPGRDSGPTEDLPGLAIVGLGTGRGGGCGGHVLVVTTATAGRGHQHPRPEEPGRRPGPHLRVRPLPQGQRQGPHTGGGRFPLAHRGVLDDAVRRPVRSRPPGPPARRLRARDLQPLRPPRSAHLSAGTVRASGPRSGSPR